MLTHKGLGSIETSPSSQVLGFLNYMKRKSLYFTGKIIKIKKSEGFVFIQVI